MRVLALAADCRLSWWIDDPQRVGRGLLHVLAGKLQAAGQALHAAPLRLTQQPLHAAVGHESGRLAVLDSTALGG